VEIAREKIFGRTHATIVSKTAAEKIERR